VTVFWVVAMMKAASTSETSVMLQQSKLRYNPRDSHNNIQLSLCLSPIPGDQYSCCEHPTLTGALAPVVKGQATQLRQL
jgi:hypothetical protein